MGKIVALGGGRFDNGEMTNVAEHIVSLSGRKNPAFLFVPTAGHDDIGGDDVVMNNFKERGCADIDILFLTHPDVTESVIAEKINKADIIYVGGGNLKFLMDTWRSTGTDKYLKKAYDDGKVMCGLSSGAMCWFRQGYDDCGENGSFIFYDCLGFIPFTSCPHYQSESWQTFADAIKPGELSGIAMDNGAGFCYVDGKYYTVCGNEDGDCFYYDKDNGFEKTNLTENPKKLNELDRI